MITLISLKGLLAPSLPKFIIVTLAWLDSVRDCCAEQATAWYLWRTVERTPVGSSVKCISLYTVLVPEAPQLAVTVPPAMKNILLSGF